MARMTKQNLNNIKDRFEQRTGTQLGRISPRVPLRALAVTAVLIAAGVLLAAFTYPLFTPLDGDALSLGGTYLGNGTVSVWVKNDSDKVLQFRDAKLFSWNEGEVEMVPGGRVLLENTRIEPHSEGFMTVDLSQAYDIAFLETTLPGKPKDSWYYLLLTNNGFLFGHDWMCSFRFTEETQAAESEPPEAPAPQGQNLEGIGEELRFYFEEAYYDVLPAFNEKHFEYQQKLQEILLRTEGTLVRPVDPMLLVQPPEEGVIFDAAVPEQEQHRLVGQGHSSLDGYRRMVGSAFSGVTSDFALQLSGMIPQEQGQTDGGGYIPLVYLFTYDTAALGQEGAFTFVCGRILPFADMENRKVYADEAYTVYDMTDLFYEDLDPYIDTFVSGNSLYCDEGIRHRLHAIRDYYADPEHLIFYDAAPRERTP